MEGGADRLPGRREGLQVGLAAPNPLLPGQALRGHAHAVSQALQWSHSPAHLHQLAPLAA